MIIYALTDPRTDEIRYVGKSHRTPHRRLRRHLAPCYLKGNTYKERWIMRRRHAAGYIFTFSEPIRG